MMHQPHKPEGLTSGPQISQESQRQQLSMCNPSLYKLVGVGGPQGWEENTAAFSDQIGT